MLWRAANPDLPALRTSRGGGEIPKQAQACATPTPRENKPGNRRPRRRSRLKPRSREDTGGVESPGKEQQRGARAPTSLLPVDPALGQLSCCLRVRTVEGGRKGQASVPSDYCLPAWLGFGWKAAFWLAGGKDPCIRGAEPEPAPFVRPRPKCIQQSLQRRGGDCRLLAS